MESSSKQAMSSGPGTATGEPRIRCAVVAHPPADRLGGKQAVGESGAGYEAGDDHHRQDDLEEPLERPAEERQRHQADPEGGLDDQAGGPDDHTGRKEVAEDLRRRMAWWRPARVAAVDIVRPILRTPHAHRPDRSRLAAVVLIALDAAELELR